MFNGHIFQETTSRRRQLLRLSPEAVLRGVFGWGQGLPMVLCIPRLEGIPAGVKVLDVGYDPMARSFTFLLEHDSFDEVPDGAYAPPVDLRCESILTEKYVREEGAGKADVVPEPDRTINFREFLG